MKSGFVSKRAWFGGVALVSAMAIAACHDDDDHVPEATAGKSGGCARDGWLMCLGAGRSMAFAAAEGGRAA